MRKIKNSMVSVLTADVSPLYDDARFDLLLEKIPEDHRGYVLRHASSQARCLSLGAELILSRICAGYGRDLSEMTLLREPGKKPVFADSPFRFSLSHSGTLVSCAVSELEVGCDLEILRPIRLELAKRFFQPDEAQIILSAPTEEDRNRLFFRYWTCKESFLKCIGTGLAYPMNAFTFSFSTVPIRVIHSFDSFSYSVFIREEESYAFALCVQDALPEHQLSVSWKTVKLV
ncbi:MAG: 4'-phosphopantetheinyl transferase superfamily protein [Clostridia bacterium]|nr:4'-phosphopantetheinyl transferase superfamily protein [Clostridia bacterium]